MLKVELNEETKEAAAKVAPDQFSLAIGRGGQNVRLAAALTGWKIKVVQEGEEEKIVSSEDDETAVVQALEEKEEPAVSETPAAESEKKPEEKSNE